VIDISNASAPQRVSAYETSAWASAVAVSEHHALVTEGWHVENGSRGRLSVIDIADFASPKRVGAYEMPGWASALAVSGNLAFVAASETGLHIIDVNDPTQPRRVGGDETLGWVRDLAVSGDRAYVVTPGAAGLWVIDISNPADLRRMGRYTSPAYASLSDLAISGRYAYLTDWRAGLQVIDVSDPANPRRVGGNGAFDAATPIAIHGGSIYVASQDGLTVLNTYQPIPRLAPLGQLDGARFHLSLRADSGQAVRLQRSVDLMTWEEWRTITGTGDPQPLVDESVGAIPARFYRAIAP